LQGKNYKKACSIIAIINYWACSISLTIRRGDVLMRRSSIIDSE